jgi:3,4-dihydroxy 2-butanone 4-phosphate synthase/GTP cyclohydrolase II
MLAIADLVSYRRATERLVEQVATSSMPTAFGTFRAVAYRSTLEDPEHLALVMGDVAEAGRSDRGALVRVHSECLTGDILGSLRCDCGGQLEQALRAIALEGCGAVVYLRGHEGRASVSPTRSGHTPFRTRVSTPWTRTQLRGCLRIPVATASAPRYSATWGSADCG